MGANLSQAAASILIADALIAISMSNRFLDNQIL
jgi:hypothetical protein